MSVFVDLSAAAAAAAAGQSSKQHNDDVDMDVDDDDDDSDVSDVFFVIVSSFSNKQLSFSSAYVDSGHMLESGASIPPNTLEQVLLPSPSPPFPSP